MSDKKKKDDDGARENRFDPKRLRLSQDFAAQVGVKKALLTVPVRKPDAQWFVRVHPDPEYRLETAVLELKEDRETYLVDPGMVSEIPGEVVGKILYAAINRQNVVFLWPVRLPNPDGRHDEWSRSALEAAQMAIKHWIRIKSNMVLGAYEVFEATGNLPEPEWPEISFEKLLEIAFRDKFINDPSHPVIQKIRGAV